MYIECWWRLQHSTTSHSMSNNADPCVYFFVFGNCNNSEQEFASITRSLICHVSPCRCEIMTCQEWHATFCSANVSWKTEAQLGRPLNVGDLYSCTITHQTTSPLYVTQLFADLAVLSLAYTSYKKFMIYHWRRVFCGVCIQKGARSFVGI